MKDGSTVELHSNYTIAADALPAGLQSLKKKCVCLNILYIILKLKKINKIFKTASLLRKEATIEANHDPKKYRISHSREH